MVCNANCQAAIIVCRNRNSISLLRSAIIIIRRSCVWTSVVAMWSTTFACDTGRCITDFSECSKVISASLFINIELCETDRYYKNGRKKKLDDPDLDTNSPRNFHNSDWRLDFHSSKSETPDDGRFWGTPVIIYIFSITFKYNWYFLPR